METSHRKTLQKAYLFQGMNDEEFTAMINCLSPQVKQFSKNEIIFLSGNINPNIGIILSGTAHAYLENIDGSQTVMSILTPMRVFGEIIASTRTQISPVTVCAVTDVTAAFIDYQKGCSMCPSACTAHRMFIQNMLRYIGDKYFYSFDRVNILREKTLRTKIAAYLYALSGNGKTATVTIPYTKTMLANYLLANRSALSKELRKMENDGLIAVNGREVELMFCDKKSL
jgi:CRP-like cAMP-binding protein